jgi:hypothetical protein
MNIYHFLRTYLEHINGQFTDYDEHRCIAVMPAAEGRYQTITITFGKSKRGGQDRVLFSSKVCEETIEFDARRLIEASASFDFGRFVVKEGYLVVEYATFLNSLTEEDVKEILHEIALLGDRYEQTITGKDIH